MHGNAIKLLFVYFFHGLASGISAEEYQQLVHIYQKEVDDVIEKDLN